MQLWTLSHVLRPLSSRNRFVAAKPLLYLPDRSPNSDFDERDRRRHLWTHQQLKRFGDVVETRTRELLEAQERLLRSWHDAATQVEKIVRGFLARRRVKKTLDGIANAASQLERAKYRMWLLKKQIVAALIVQRAYRRHAAHLAFIEACRTRLQRSTRLFLFRRERIRAARTIQRLFRSHQYRRSVLTHLRKLCRLLRSDRQKQQLEQLSQVFNQARNQRLRDHQDLLWERFSDKMAQLQRVERRKASLTAIMLPLLVVDRRKQRQMTSKSTSSPSISQTVQPHRSLNQAPSLLPSLSSLNPR